MQHSRGINYQYCTMLAFGTNKKVVPLKTVVRVAIAVSKSTIKQEHDIGK